MKSPITTHVLDTSTGTPATNVKVTLELYYELEGWRELASGVTDADGRIMNLLTADSRLALGVYRLTFEAGRYLNERNASSFYPYIPVVFEVNDSSAHYHIPLLLSPFGYSTYRGS